LIAEEGERAIGMSLAERFPPQNQTIMHKILFAHDIPIVENLGGAIAGLVGRQFYACAFPWKFAGGEAAFVRVVAFVEGQDR
jgi:kynurenine formamidase